MMKFLWILVLCVVSWRLLTGRWPWQPGAKTIRDRARRQARDLLGVRPDASKGEILDAHRRLVAMVHPDRGGRNEDVHEANAARDILLDAHPDQFQEQA